MQKDIFLSIHLKFSTPVSLILASGTVVLCGGVCGAAEIHQLQKLQNRAARIIADSNYDAPCKPLIESLGWKTINDMIQFESRVMVFKSINRLTPQYLLDLFVANSTNPSYSQRSTDTDLTLSKRNTSTGQKSFSYWGTKLWNGLPDPAKRATRLQSSPLFYSIFISFN